MGTAANGVKPGDTVEGRYRIIKVVGEGGMGTVFLAEHVLIKRRVAIKILRSELATDAAVIERFMNEARAAGTLGHPNIVESTDMGFTRDEVPYIVFEYLEGTLLTDEIYRVKGMPPRRALRIGAQIASALHAAHTAGIVHRDLKSDNIFLTDKEEGISDHVKVLDFGISRFLEAEDDRSSGARNTTMGTPEFMAPEQITTPEAVDARADIYALGVVLYEMLAARRPFSDNEPGRKTGRRMADAEQLLHRIVNDPPPPLYRPDLPPGLEELLHDKLLAKSPDQRFQSMKDVQGAFEAFTGVARRDSQPIAAIAPPPPIEPLPQAAKLVELPPPPPTRRLTWLWLVAAVLAGLGGAALMFAGGHAAAPSNDPAAMTALQGDADKLAAALEAEARAAHLRADGIASAPMLRAAIETDTATIKDLLTSESLYKPVKGQVLEIYQVKDGRAVPLVHLPEAAHAIKPPTVDTLVHSDGKGVEMVVSAPITKQEGEVGGSLAIALPIELDAFKQTLATHAQQAVLVIADQQLVLVGAETAPAGKQVTLPVTPVGDWKIPGVSLNAVIAPSPTMSAGNSLQTPQLALWGLGGALLLIYLWSLLRGHRRG